MALKQSSMEAMELCAWICIMLNISQWGSDDLGRLLPPHPIVSATIACVGSPETVVSVAKHLICRSWVMLHPAS